jgi:hypothetical protein
MDVQEVVAASSSCSRRTQTINLNEQEIYQDLHATL